MVSGMENMGEVYRTPRFDVTDDDSNVIGAYWFEVNEWKKPGNDNDERQYTFRVVEQTDVEKIGGEKPLREKTVDDVVYFMHGVIEGEKRITRLSKDQDTIKLPHGACEYISHYYDKEMETWIVLYEKKPVYHNQAIVDTGIPSPVPKDGRIKYVPLTPFAARIARKAYGKRLDGPIHGPVEEEGFNNFLREIEGIQRKTEERVNEIMDDVAKSTQLAMQEIERDTERRMAEMDANVEAALGRMNYSLTGSYGNMETWMGVVPSEFNEEAVRDYIANLPPERRDMAEKCLSDLLGKNKKSGKGGK